jgi:hypothetical protein
MKRAKKRDIRKIPVRFNYWFDGKARKVTLLPGVPVTFYVGRKTDEGYRTENATLFLDGRKIIEQYRFIQKDCDGLHCDTGERYCLVSKRASRRVAHHLGDRRDRGPLPDFVTTDAEVYDQFAAMAGY